MIPATLTAGQAGRLFFLAYTSTGAPHIGLTPAMLAGGGVQWWQTQAAGGNWIGTSHHGLPWDTITLGYDNEPLAPGKLIRHINEDGRKNLYSIDVAHTHVINHPDVTAVRLTLTSSGIMFVPYTHLIVPEPTVTLENINQKLDVVKDSTLADIRFLIDQIHAKVHES